MRCEKSSKNHGDVRNMCRTKVVGGRLKAQSGEDGENHIFGRHDMVRRVVDKEKPSIWCRKCSGYARRRMGPKLMNQCKPENMDTKEYGKMLKTNFNP